MVNNNINVISFSCIALKAVSELIKRDVRSVINDYIATIHQVRYGHQEKCLLTSH